MAGVGRGIVIPLSLNPRSWLQGMRVVERSLDDMSDDLADVEDAGDRIERALTDNFRDISRAASDVDVDIDSRGMKGRLGGVGAEVGDEFAENFGEAIRSGNPADALLETFTSLGPALGALGLGAALVTGIVNSVRQETARQRKAVADAMSGILTDALSAAEQTGQSISQALLMPTLNLTQKLSTLQEYYGTETLQDAFVQAGKDAAVLGVRVDDVIDGIGGVGAQQERANRRIQDANRALQTTAERADKVPAAIGAAGAKARSTATQLQRNADRAADIAAGVRDVNDQWRGVRDTVRDYENDLKRVNGMTVTPTFKAKFDWSSVPAYARPPGWQS